MIFQGVTKKAIVKSVKAGFLGGGVQGGAHLPWDDFAPLLKFSAPPLRTFAPPPNNIIKILKDNYTSLIKKYKI